jgi:phosphatidylinositol glycan class B
MSSASFETEHDSSSDSHERRPSPSPKPPSLLERSSSQNVLLFLIAFRLVNALCVRTFFQPDEFFQSLEPAWDIVFGKESGAWITWVWTDNDDL